MGEIFCRKRRAVGGGSYISSEKQFPELEIGDMTRDLVRRYHSYMGLVENRVFSNDRRILERKLAMRGDGDWGGAYWSVGIEILGKACGKAYLLSSNLNTMDQDRVQAERTANLGPDLGKGIKHFPTACLLVLVGGLLVAWT